MKRTQVAREVADALHATEASLDATLENARQMLDRLVLAKGELGLTGTMGDASIARMKESVEAIEQARALMIESHQEAYAVMKATIRTTGGPGMTFPTGQIADDVRAA